MPTLPRGALIALVSKARGPLLIVFLASLLVMAVQVVAQATPLVATYYSNKYAGKPTASGQPYDPYALTAAHPSLPFGTKLSVSYGDKNVIVTVNDRIPFEADSELDLSWAAAQALGLTELGTAIVDAAVVEAQRVPPT